MSLAKDLSYAEWEQVGFKLANFGRSMQWWLGDWINYGSKKYGETYKAAIQATGLTYNTVIKFSSLCTEFELKRRRFNLAFQHHMEVWGLEKNDQDELLDIAERDGLSCAKLRELVRQKKGLVNTPEASEQQADQDQSSNNQIETSPAEDWSATCVTAFAKVENRLETLRVMLSQFTETEKQILREWLAS